MLSELIKIPSLTDSIFRVISFDKFPPPVNPFPEIISIILSTFKESASSVYFLFTA